MNTRNLKGENTITVRTHAVELVTFSQTERKFRMRRSLLLAVCTLVFVVFAASSAPISPVEAVFQSSPTTPIVIAQSTQYGVFLASQATGSISFCANSTFIPQPSGG